MAASFSRRALVATICGSTLAALALIATAATAQDVAPVSAGLTEDQYVDAVIAHNLVARVAEREAALGRAEMVSAGAWPNPSLAWNREASAARAGGTQDIFSASIPLVLSGRLGLQKDAAEHRALAAQAQADSARAQLRHHAVRAFGAVLVAKERSAVLTASLAQLQELTRAVGVRERAGAASGYERLRIEVEQASVATQLRAAQAEERRASADALRLLAGSARELPALAAPATVERPLPRLETMLAALGQQRADVRALELEARAAESARSAAARSWVPDPTLSGGVQLLDVGGSGRETGYVVGVEVPLPFFDHRQGEQARAAAARDLARTKRAALIQDARARLVSAFADVTDRRAQLADHRASVLAKTDELRKVAAAAYRGGAAELLVLVDAERSARDAQLTAIDLSNAILQTETDLLLLSGAYDSAPNQRAAR